MDHQPPVFEYITDNWLANYKKQLISNLCNLEYCHLFRCIVTEFWKRFQFTHKIQYISECILIISTMILYASLITLMIILNMKASATIKTPATSVCMKTELYA